MQISIIIINNVAEGAKLRHRGGFYFEPRLTQGLNKLVFTLFTALYCTILSKHPIQNLKEKEGPWLLRL